MDNLNRFSSYHFFMTKKTIKFIFIIAITSSMFITFVKSEVYTNSIELQIPNDGTLLLSGSVDSENLAPSQGKIIIQIQFTNKPQEVFRLYSIAVSLRVEIELEQGVSYYIVKESFEDLEEEGSTQENLFIFPYNETKENQVLETKLECRISATEGPSSYESDWLVFITLNETEESYFLLSTIFISLLTIILFKKRKNSFRV